MVQPSPWCTGRQAVGKDWGVKPPPNHLTAIFVLYSILKVYQSSPSQLHDQGTCLKAIDEASQRTARGQAHHLAAVERVSPPATLRLTPSTSLLASLAFCCVSFRLLWTAEELRALVDLHQKTREKEAQLRVEQKAKELKARQEAPKKKLEEAKRESERLANGNPFDYEDDD